MSRPPIAVVITCHDLGRTLDEALNSARNQTLPPHEVVIVDDGSTDLYTRQTLARLEAAGHSIVRTPNRGVSAARNTGIGRTHAPYVVLLDADDAFEPTYFELAATRLDEDASVAFISCGVHCIGASTQVWVPPPPDLIRSLTGEVVHISSMFRRQAWETVGGFDEALPAHEDVDFWTRVLAHGFKGDVLPEPLLRYRVRSGSNYQRAIQAGTHTVLMAQIYRKHEKVLAEQSDELLRAKERFILEQQAHGDHVHRSNLDLNAEIAQLDAEISAVAHDLSAAGVSPVELGDFRRTDPISSTWGGDRGRPLDRYYIERFLERFREDVRGRVLEVKDPGYTRRLGGDRVTAVDVLDIDAGNPQATVVTDLTNAASIPDGTYDCFILTQTLGLIYDVEKAVAEAYRILKPGGVLLCTVPAAGRISYEDRHLDGDFWRFTEASTRRLFASAFPIDAFEVTGFGNVLSCAAFLYGLAPHELRPEELDLWDPFFPVVYGVRAVKRARDAVSLITSSHLAGERGTYTTRVASDTGAMAAVLMYHRVSDEPEEGSNLCLSVAEFRGHMNYLREGGYRVISLHELQLALSHGDLGERTVALTFDDGYAEMLTHVAPILAEQSLPATYFIVGETLDGPHEFWWDTLRRIFAISHNPPPRLCLELPGGVLDMPTATGDDRRLARAQLTEAFFLLPRTARDHAVHALLEWNGRGGRPVSAPRPMTADELQRLAMMPGASLGAHTESHAWLPTQTNETLRTEVTLTKQRIQDLLRIPVTSFAYPYGGYDLRTIEAVRETGFDEAVTTEERAVRAADQVLLIPRLDVGSCDTAAFADGLRLAFERGERTPPFSESERPLRAPR